MKHINVGDVIYLEKSNLYFEVVRINCDYIGPMLRRCLNVTVKELGALSFEEEKSKELDIYLDDGVVFSCGNGGRCEEAIEVMTYSQYLGCAVIDKIGELAKDKNGIGSGK